MKTFGWDTAFIISTDRLNAMLEKNSDKTVLQFDAALPGLPASKAKGRYAPWQMTDGGSNEIVHIKLTIDEGRLSDGNRTYDLAGLTLVFATHLQWLAYDGQREDLRFDYNKLGEMGNPPQRGELSVIALRDPNQVLPPDVNALLAYALGADLVANVEQVRFVFAAVNLIPPATNSWLAPRKSAYCLAKREGGGQSFLAILSVTTDRDVSQLQRTVDSAALPNDTNASFVISDNLYLMNVIAPSLGKSMNTGADAFYYDAGARVLRNNRRLWTKRVKSGAITYDPWIDSLEIRSGQGDLQGRYSGGVDLKAGISMTYTITANNAAAYNIADGTLRFQPDPRPGTSHKADIPWYWFIGGPIVAAVVAIVVAVISKDIANDVSNDNRERLALGRHPPSSILWGGSDAIAVTSVGVADSLYLFGNV